jgi:hypothetical protein
MAKALTTKGAGTLDVTAGMKAKKRGYQRVLLPTSSKKAS